MHWIALLAPALAAPPSGHAEHHAPAEVGEAPEMLPVLQSVAREHGVPEDLLIALAWEATRIDPFAVTDWGGYGAFDLREEGGPSLEKAAILLDVSPDLLIDEPVWNARGAAALLAWYARQSNDGALPDVDNLEAWWDATRAMSGSHDPDVQQIFATYVYELIRYGVDGVTHRGEPVRFGYIPVDLESLAPHPIAPPPNYAGSYQFSSAHSSNYTNQSRSPSSITKVVVHTVQGSYSSCINWFKNPAANVSAHYVVRSSDGQITQMVKEEDKAWHAGNANGYSIGIEHEGWVDQPDTWYTDAMYRESAKLVADIVARTGVKADRSHIIAHHEVPGATHTDPGPGWDWDYYMSLITGSYVVAGTLTGVVRADDIYNEDGELPGATVTLLETGETTTTNAEGYYRFEDLPSGSYTVRASLDGYQDATCSKDVVDSSTYWCSMAMLEADDVFEDTGLEDTGTDDTAVRDTAGLDVARERHRARVRSGCDTTGGLGLAWLVALPLLLRRRQRC